MATTQRVQYGIDISANTSQAKQAIADLQRSIQSLQNTAEGDNFLNEKMNKAAAAAKELQLQLAKATNVNTGKLNLSLLNDNLKASGKSAQQLMTSLLEGGRTGQQAFASMANAIAQAEVPLKQTNKLVADFANTLKNTVKWEISSNLVHGLESAMSGAVSYAKNLNSSLTDIRIVTGQSTEQMAKFAQYANKAAKDLSTSTRSYADAALIYYQQGDSDAMAKKKAELTIKAANASFDSDAKEMSEYLTAVWNSYQVGSDQLEHYIDVMASLGAKTATSLEEIATSMQKVAATANTVGVSMEQMSSIISTVSSVTREAPESIGTSYKTILARMGDLKLGGSDEDGVTLGTVSSQLDKIGVKVLDANNDLRDMGDIIWDLGEKWQTMNSATKAAVAQAVAGKRQYTQLMALFDNWDMYKENLQISADSDGALEKMAGTWTEGWEAASKRVQASLEGIYGKLLDDQGFIKILNIISDLLDKVDSLIDGFGGLKGIILSLGTVASNVFNKQIALGINKSVDNLTTYFTQFKGKGLKENLKNITQGNTYTVGQLKTIEENNKWHANIESQQKNMNTDYSKQVLDDAGVLLKYKNDLIKASVNLDDAQQSAALKEIENLGEQQRILERLIADKEELQKAEARNKINLENNWNQAGVAHLRFTDVNGNLAASSLKRFIGNGTDSGFDLSGFQNGSYSTTASFGDIFNLYNRVSKIGAYFSQASSFGNKTDIVNYLEQSKAIPDDLLAVVKQKDEDKLQEYLLSWSNRAETVLESIIAAVGNDAGLDATTKQQFEANARNTQDIIAQKAENLKNIYGQKKVVNGQQKGIDESLRRANEQGQSLGKTLATISSTTMTIASSLNAGANFISLMDDKSASLTSKLSSGFQALSSIAMAFMSPTSWLGWVAVGAVAIGGIMSAIEDHQKKLKEEQDKTLDEIEEKSQNIQTNLSSNEELIKNYNELYNTYLKTGEGQDELTKSAYALADAYDMVGAKIQIANGNFIGFNESLRTAVEATFSEAQEYYDSKEKEYEKIIADRTTGAINTNRFLTGGSYYLSNEQEIQRENIAYDNNIWKLGNTLRKIKGIKSSEDWSSIFYDDSLSIEISQAFKDAFKGYGEIINDSFIENFIKSVITKDDAGNKIISFDNIIPTFTEMYLKNNSFADRDFSLNESLDTDKTLDKNIQLHNINITDLLSEDGSIKIDANDPFSTIKALEDRKASIADELTSVQTLLDNLDAYGLNEEEDKNNLEKYKAFLQSWQSFLTEAYDSTDIQEDLDSLKDMQEYAKQIDVLKGGLYKIVGKNDTNTDPKEFIELYTDIGKIYDTIAFTREELNKYIATQEDDISDIESQLAEGESIKTIQGYQAVVDKDGNVERFIIKKGKEGAYENAKNQIVSKYFNTYGSFNDLTESYAIATDYISSLSNLGYFKDEVGDTLQQSKDDLSEAIMNFQTQLIKDGITEPTGVLYDLLTTELFNSPKGLSKNEIIESIQGSQEYKNLQHLSTAKTLMSNYDSAAGISLKSHYSSADEAVSVLKQVQELGGDELLQKFQVAGTKSRQQEVLDNWAEQQLEEAKKEVDATKWDVETNKQNFIKNVNDQVKIIGPHRQYSYDTINKGFSQLSLNSEGELMYAGDKYSTAKTEAALPEFLRGMDEDKVKTLWQDWQSVQDYETAANNAKLYADGLAMIQPDDLDKLNTKYQVLIDGMSSLPTTTEGWLELADAMGLVNEETKEADITSLKNMSNQERSIKILEQLKNEMPNRADYDNDNEFQEALASWESKWKVAVDNVASYGTVVYDSLKAYSDDLQEKIDKQKTQIDDMKNAVSNKKYLGEADAWGMTNNEKYKFNNSDRFTQVRMIADAQNQQIMLEQQKTEIENSQYKNALKSDGWNKIASLDKGDNQSFAKQGADSADFANKLSQAGFEPAIVTLFNNLIKENKVSLYNQDRSNKTNSQIVDDLNNYISHQIDENTSSLAQTIAQSNQALRELYLSIGEEAGDITRTELVKMQSSGKFDVQDQINAMSIQGQSVNDVAETEALQKAIQNAMALKGEGDWSKVDQSDRELLTKYNITGFSQLEDASLQCATALQAFAKAAKITMEKAFVNAGYVKSEKKNERGYYTWTTDGITPISEEEQKAYESTVDAVENTNYETKALTDMWETNAKAVGMASDEYDSLAQHLYEVAGGTGELKKQNANVQKQYNDLAFKVSNAAKGFEDLQKNSKDVWAFMKKDSNKGTTEYLKNITSMKSSMAKIFNTDISKITDKFVSDHLDQLHKMATGTQKEALAAQDAIEDDLVKALAEQDNIDITAKVKIDGVEQSETLLEAFQNSLDKYDNQEIGTTITINDEPALASLSAFAAQAGMTSDQIQAMFNAIGWDPDIQYVDVPSTWVNGGDGTFSYPKVSFVNGATIVNGYSQADIHSDFQQEELIHIPVIGSAKKISNPGGGSRQKSSGGGGKKKQRKDYKTSTDEIDRYHYIEQRLKRTNAQMTENDKLKEKAYGSKYLSYLDSEISKLKDLESEYKMYKDEAAGYLASDRARMAELGAQFDVEGNIKNYEEMRKAWLDAYNAGVDAWNNSDQEEGAELAFKQVEKQYEEKTKALQKYEESLEKYEEAQNNILEQQNKVAEALLEQIQTKLEYTTELNETDLKLLEHYSKRYEDQLADQGKSMMNILNQAKQYEENLQAVTEAQAALNAQHAAGQLTDAKYQEGLADLIDKSLEYADALEDLKNDIKEVYQNALDLADEELEKHTAKIDAAKEAVQSYIDILGLLGRGENFANLQKYYYGIYENSLQNLKIQKAYLDTLNQQAEYFKGKGTQMTELEKEQYEALQEKIRDVNSEVLSSTQDTLSALQDAYNNAISDIFKKLDDAMGGAEDSVQALADKYGYYQEEQQRYVSTAKELYEVSKLNRSIEQSIEDSTTAASKERLKDLQKLIEAQSKANKLTQYDLDMMNLQYQLALAMEELENAKNAKDTVRLTRDDNGNYGYQYTADQNKINDAQQKYEDVLQQINELAANRISELEQSFLNAQQQYLQSAQEIASDMTLTEEQRAEKLTNLQKQYAETMKYIQEQYNTAFKDLSVNQEAISKHYGETLVETTSSTALQVNDQMKSMIDNIDTYIQNLDAAIGTEGAASTAWKNYVGDIAEVAKALTGIDTGNVQANIDALTKALAESMSKYTEESKDTVDEAQKTFNTIANSLKSVNDATEAWNKHAETIERTETAYEKLAETMQKNIKILANGATYSDIFGTPDGNSDNPLSTGTVKAPTISGAEATGGLSSVIEANFTNKVSTSIGEATARALSDSLRTQIEAYIAALNTNFDTIGGALKSSSWTIEQNVHIDASFPNVQDHNEIEEAINDLINSATQYANRKGE